MTFRNCIAAFSWGITAVFMLVVVAMTCVLLRDGAPSGYSPLLMVGVLGLFWLAGLGVAAHVARQPCVRVTVHPEGHMTITWRYPVWMVTRDVPPAEVPPAAVVESRDSDGDPYFHAQVVLTDGTPVDLTEGHDREACRAACDRFNAAVRRGAV